MCVCVLHADVMSVVVKLKTRFVSLGQFVID